MLHKLRGYYEVLRMALHQNWELPGVHEGICKGPYQVFALGRDFLRAKTAYQYSSKELLKMYFRGEISKVDLENTSIGQRNTPI